MAKYFLNCQKLCKFAKLDAVPSFEYRPDYAKLRRPNPKSTYKNKQIIQNIYVVIQLIRRT